MAKYSVELKLQLVQSYDSRQLSALEIQRRFGVSARMLRSWHQRFRRHGVAAFTKKYSHYDADFKLNVLQYQREHKLSGHETVVYFDIRGGPGVLGQWRKRYDEGGFAALEPRPKGRSPKMKRPPPKQAKAQGFTLNEELIQLRKENEYLRAENDYLKKLDALLQQKELAQTPSRLLQKKRR